MSSAREQQIRALVREALERPAQQRAAFVAELAGADEDLRRSVETQLSQQNATDLDALRTSTQGEQAAELPKDALLNHYRIDGVLGRGGMGVVYRATDTRLGRPVAIKFLSAAVADSEIARRFRQEAKTASNLNHPHIVTVHDVGEHEGRQYIVSELVDGGTLDDWALTAKRRTWRQSVELLIGVADALAVAHAAGVLHRDVKPGNILIGSNGYAKLADFGLAKLLESSAGGQRGDRSRSGHTTRAGVVVGTVAYMSPEQAAGHPLDARSDVFSFGIVLYELLAGRRPFEAANDLEVLKSIAHATPAPLPDDVPEFLRIVVDKALEKQPADRYQSMQELVVDLRRVVRKPTSSQAMSASDVRLVVGVVKRRPVAALGSAAAIALAAAAVTYLALSRFIPPSMTTPVDAWNNYEIAQLTTSGNAVSPAISPDGKWVAYVQLQESGGTRSSSLWIRQIATSRNQTVVPAEPGVDVLGPVVTPDGDFVDFLRKTRSRISLSRVSYLGGAATPLVDNVGSPVGYSPDGRRLAFVRVHIGQSTELVVADADGANEHVVANSVQPTILLNVYLTTQPNARPAWSPDGRVIALLEIDSRRQVSRVVFVDIASGKPTIRDLGVMAQPQGLAWLDSTSVVVSASKTPGQPVQLWRMSYPDGQITPLINDLTSYVGIDVDATRKSLVTSRRETLTTVWVSDERGARGVQIVAPTPGDRYIVTLRVAGTRLLYDAAQNGHVSIMAVPLNGGTPEEVVPRAGAPAVTSNGDTLAFTRSDEPGLWKIPPGKRQPVVLVPENATYPIVTPDDRNIVFISSRSGQQSPWIVPIDGGEPKPIVDAFAAAPGLDISPDGQRVLFLTRSEKDEPTLVVCDLPACMNRRDIDLPPNAAPRPGVRWTLDGRQVAYVDSRGKNIWALPLDNGSSQQITEFGDDAPPGDIASFAWSRDGLRLAIARTTTTNDIVLLRLKP